MIAGFYFVFVFFIKRNYWVVLKGVYCVFYC